MRWEADGSKRDERGRRLFAASEANAVLLPAVLRFNAPALGDRARRLRQVIGLDDDADLAVWAETFAARLGLPPNLAAMGVPEDILDDIAEAATFDHTHPTNARPATAQDYRRLLAESFASGGAA